MLNPPKWKSKQKLLKKLKPKQKRRANFRIIQTPTSPKAKTRKESFETNGIFDTPTVAQTVPETNATATPKVDNPVASDNIPSNNETEKAKFETEATADCTLEATKDMNSVAVEEKAKTNTTLDSDASTKVQANEKVETKSEAEIVESIEIKDEIDCDEDDIPNHCENDKATHTNSQGSKGTATKDEPAPPDASNSTSSLQKSTDEMGLSLVFKDFVDLQTRLVLVPFIEEEGKGAVVAAYPEDDRFDGLVVASTNNEEIQELTSMDFTDILAGLREQQTPISLKFRDTTSSNERENADKMSDSMIDVDLCDNEVNEEKKDDDCRTKPIISNDKDDPIMTTTKSDNHDSDTNRGTPKSNNTSAASENSMVEPLSAPQSPKQTYFEKRHSTPSKEHKNSLNSVLDDHRGNESTTAENAKATLSSGMYALSAWGMRMKAKSEKLLVNAGAKATQQQKRSNPSVSDDSSSPHSTCDMYVQSNVGAYFPISKSASKNNKPQHLQAVTTSSLFCIRKSASEPCVVGRTTTHNNKQVKYSFQWYRSSSQKSTSHRNRIVISPSILYNNENLDGESIGDSTLTSGKRSRAYSSAESVSSSCSSWSSSSNSSSLCSSYSGSTDGVSRHTISLASMTNTTAGKTTRENSKEATTIWIPMRGATGATFQPNTTLVGKKLRCVVTIRPVKGTASDSSASMSSRDSSTFGENGCDDINKVSILGDDEVGNTEMIDNILEEEEGVEKIVCDLVIPIQADMVLFNGARQAMMTRGSANFGNLLGRRRRESTNTETASSLACGKAFRVEVTATRKNVLYTPPPSTTPDLQHQQGKPQRRTMNVNSVQIYCRASSNEEYLQLTDIPLLQVTARASPTNSKHVDLLFPFVPPLPSPAEGCDENIKKTSTHTFLAEYCSMDHAFSSEGAISRLELEAPNRMTRESFLLALGIANFRGKPGQLDNKKVLYRDNEPILKQIKHQHPSSNTLASSKTSPKSNSPNDAQAFQQPTSSPQSQVLKVAGLKNDDECDSVSYRNDEQNCQQVLTANVMLSPPKTIMSPISCHSNQESSPQTMESIVDNPSIPKTLAMPSVVVDDNAAKVKELERQMEKLRAQLAKKDKIVSELQQQVQGSEGAHQKTKHELSKTCQELKQSQEDCERIQMSKRHVERSMQSQHEAMQKVELKHKAEVDELEGELEKQAEKIADLEKLNRSLQNEKAILGASVEARESKLVKLEELQASNSELSKKVAQQGTLEVQLEESHKKYECLLSELESQKESETKYQKSLEDAKATIQTIHKQIQGEREKATSCQRDLEIIQKKNQQLKGERNSFKQKNESLSKEVARLCRGGKNIRDIEKVIADHEALSQEAKLLRVQKRKALEDAHKYRISYEQLKAAEEVALSIKPDEKETRRLLERTAELERLLAEMTDYVSAKQMQLDTMVEVNQELQKEIHSLAQANLRQDEV